MDRGRSLLVAVSLALLLGPAAAGGAPLSMEVHVRLNCSSVSGRISPDLPLTVTVKAPGGAIKGHAAVTSSGGYFDVDFREGHWPFLQIVPGDTVVVASDGAVYKHTLGRIALTRLDPATGTVSGQVSPRRPTVNVYQNYRRLTGSGWQSGCVSREDLPTSPTGVFSTTFVRLRRLDDISVEYNVGAPERGAFTVYHDVEVPGLDVTIGTSIARLHAESGRTFEGRLAGATGALKAISRTTTTNTYDDDEGVLDFRSAAGDPVAIAVNDRVTVTGRWSFAATVPLLRLTAQGCSPTSRTTLWPSAPAPSPGMPQGTSAPGTGPQCWPWTGRERLQQVLDGHRSELRGSRLAPRGPRQGGGLTDTWAAPPTGRRPLHCQPEEPHQSAQLMAGFSFGLCSGP